MCVGSIYATDNADINSINPHDSIIYDLDDVLYEIDDSDLDEFDDSDWNDLGYYESFKDFDLENIGYVASKGLKSFDYLEFKIISYLNKFGNSDENWTESDEFLAEYKLYLDNSSNYALNESNECYELYLKIYDSIVSTFGEYNLTQNETDYLSFLIIFYLNHYGNCSDIAWNESCKFSTCCPPYYLTMSHPIVLASGSAPDDHVDGYGGSGPYNPGSYGNVVYSNILSNILNNSTDSNSTQLNNSTITVAPKSTNGIYDFLMVLFVIVMMVLVII